jgi:hypothetical protein
MKIQRMISTAGNDFTAIWEHRYIPGLIDDILADRTMSYEDAVRLVEGLVASLETRGLTRPVNAGKVAELTVLIDKLTEMRDYFAYILGRKP